jgi:hypothetical protein
MVSSNVNQEKECAEHRNLNDDLNLRPEKENILHR